MPPSTMIRAITTALGAAVAAGAAQLGTGYGLGIFSWLPTVRGVDEAAWLASLAWTVWISATSVVLGTLAGDRAAVPTVAMSPVSRVLWRSALALAAALGGLVVVALIALPARVAQPANTSAPHLIVGGYAIAGVLLGLFVALLAVNARPIAANVVVTTAWLWLLAIVARIDTLAAGGEFKVAQLGVWQVTHSGPWFESIYLPGAALATGSAVLIGAFAAWPGANRGSSAPAVALSGGVGPAMVAAAYLLAAPALGDIKPEQLSAHQVAPYAVLAGLAGSVLVALLTVRTRRSAARRTDHPKPAAVNAAQPRVAGDAV